MDGKLMLCTAFALLEMQWLAAIRQYFKKKLPEEAK